MKIQNHLFGLVALTLLISSCGSISISQKRYSRGLNIDWFAAKEDKGAERKQAVPRKLKTIDKTSVQTEAPSVSDAAEEQEAPVFASGEEALVPLAASSVSAPAQKSPLAEKKGLRKSVQAYKEFRQEMKAQSHQKPLSRAAVAEAQESQSSDVNLILLVILAILLPPLAVYLYFGELNIHFWINLILVLVGGGVGIAVGYWGLAIIHALLVVFGVFG